MKFQILNNEKLQFFNDVGELTGEIFLSGSGDMLITPTSASGDIILGSEDVVGSVEIGNVNVPATLSLLGGGTITSNGNTLTIGDSGSGDQVIIGVPITASNVISSSYALTASHALNAGGGGGGSTFPFTGDARITGSLIVSGAFEPRGLGGETNVVIGGAGAGSSISSAHATHNVIIGYDAAEQLNDEDYNVIIGSNAGNFLTHGVDNVLIGGRTGRNFKGTTGNKIRGNTLVGHYAGYGGTNANSFSANNTGLGEQVLHEIDGGSGSIAIGYFAGYNIGSGNNNIIIGSGSLGTTTMNDQLRIGHASLHIISGSLSTGDVIFYNTASAPNFSGSFQGDGSNLTGTGTTIVANPGSSGAGALSTITIGAQSFSVGGGGGGSSIFTAADGFQKTINNLIVSQSNTTSSLTVINSGSTVFDVRGSVGQLFEVQDGLDGVLMSVNDISGIPILTVSSSGDVILAEGSTLQGTAATASFVAGVSAAFPFAGAAVITGSLDITGSGDDIFKVRSQSGSLFSVDDGLDGILMSVNDISGLPLFEISSSGDVELVVGDISGSATSTASFGHLMNNGVNFDTAVSSSAAAAGFGSGGGGGGSVPAGTVSGSAQITQLGFVTSSATASFITAAQTASFMTSSATGSFNNLTITNFSGSEIPGNGSTSSIAVTVVSTGAGNKYALDGTITASISLTAGNSYKFDQSDSSNSSGGGHPFRFSTDTGGSSNYSTGVTISGTPGDAGAFVQISVTNSTPTLYYYCTNHANMGLGGTLSIITGSQIQNGFLEVSGSTRLSGSISIAGPTQEIVFAGGTSTNYPKIDFPDSINIGNGTTMHTSSLGDVVIGQNASTEYGSTYLGTQRRVAIGYNADVNGAGSVAIGHGATVGNTEGVAIGKDATTTAYRATAIGYSANAASTSVAVGYNAQATGTNTVAIRGTAASVDGTAINGTGGQRGVTVGRGGTSGQNAVALGYLANAGNFSTAIGPSITITGAYSFAFAQKAYGGATTTLSSASAFAVYHNNTEPTIFFHKDNTSWYDSTGQFGFGTKTPSATLTVSGSFATTGSAIISSSNSDVALTVEGSGSTLFEVIGSEGTIFSLDDELDGELFTVNDRSGIPQLLVSSSGRIEAEEGEAVIRSQRPIVTVGTNPFTASLDNAGQYFRVGGNVTCSIFVSASVHCPIGAEFDFFQTSSAGNMLFETGSGVTLNSKNGNLNLAGQFSSATLKYVNNDEWDLMGDLT